MLRIQVVVRYNFFIIYFYFIIIFVAVIGCYFVLFLTVFFNFLKKKISF